MAEFLLKALCLHWSLHIVLPITFIFRNSCTTSKMFGCSVQKLRNLKYLRNSFWSEWHLISRGVWSEPVLTKYLTMQLWNFYAHWSFTKILSNLFYILLIGLLWLHQVNLAPTKPWSASLHAYIVLMKSKHQWALWGLPPNFSLGSMMALKSPPTHHGLLIWLLMISMLSHRPFLSTIWHILLWCMYLHSGYPWSKELVVVHHWSNCFMVYIFPETPDFSIDITHAMVKGQKSPVIINFVHIYKGFKNSNENHFVNISMMLKCVNSLLGSYPLIFQK